MGLLKLDLLTAVLCGNLTLAMMCVALLLARPIPTHPTRTLRLWLFGLLAYVIATVATTETTAVLHLSLQHPVTVALVAMFLSAHGALQWFALNDVRGYFVRRFCIVWCVLLLAASAATIPWLLNDALRLKWPIIVNAVALAATFQGLTAIARQGVGGRTVAIALFVQLLINIIFLAGLIDPLRGGLPVIVIGGIVTTLAATLGLLIWHQGRMEDLLARIAMTDSLTGALNRHGLNQRLNQELARSQRHRRPLSIVLCDLDHFKCINDALGHNAGDDVLRRFVGQSQQALREGDCIGRWGGEEFVLVLPDCATRHAVAIAERMRDNPLVLPEGPTVTFSAGVATSGVAGCGYDIHSLLTCADRLLYVAKETRDRVVAAANDTPAPRF